MTPLGADEIRGTWATILTPFDEREALDVGALHREIELILGAGPQGVYTHGTAGEFFNQTEEEWEQVATTVAEACEAVSMPFQIGASHPSPIVALNRVKRARRMEPAAIQVTLPNWLPLNRQEIHHFLKDVSYAADGVGLVLYNPPHATTMLDPTALCELCVEFTGIVGVKTADGDEEWYRAMAPVLERVSVFVPGHHLATGLAHGAHGAYSNMACLSPAGAVRWGRLARGDLSEASAVERAIAAFMDAAVAPLQRKGYTSVTLDKALAAAGGWMGRVGHVRRPHLTATHAEIECIRKAARSLLPEFLHPAPGHA